MTTALVTSDGLRTHSSPPLAITALGKTKVDTGTTEDDPYSKTHDSRSAKQAEIDLKLSSVIVSACFEVSTGRWDHSAKTHLRLETCNMNLSETSVSTSAIRNLSLAHAAIKHALYFIELDAQSQAVSYCDYAAEHLREFVRHVKVPLCEASDQEPQVKFATH
mgnify:CR=1 FL=1